MQISIPSPCTQSWDQMSPSGEGRYCRSCEKTVVDFTRMSDAELLARLQKKPGQPLCGRFRGDQVERPLIHPVKQYAFYQRFGLAFLGILGSLSAVGQNRKPSTVASKPFLQTEPSAKQKTAKPKVPKKRNIQFVAVTGRVVSEGEGVGGLKVVLADGKYMTKTDSTGTFQLRIPKHLYASSVLKVVASLRYGGWEGQLSEVNKDSIVIQVTDFERPLPERSNGSIEIMGGFGRVPSQNPPITLKNRVKRFFSFSWLKRKKKVGQAEVVQK